MRPDIPFERHAVEWTPEKVSRFWAWLTTSQPDEHYFARVYGRAIVDFARAHGALRGRALDFGCGPGFLIEHLLAAGVRASGLDLSNESLERVRSKFAGHSGFDGAFHAPQLPSELAAESFDVVFLLETIEHLSREQAIATLAEIRRLLRPAGAIVITTPNEERLQDRTVMCPDCGCEFHRVQHVQSFSRRTLADLVETGGFRVGAIETRTLGPETHLWRLRERLHRWRNRSRGVNLLLLAHRP